MLSGLCRRVVQAHSRVLGRMGSRARAALAPRFARRPGGLGDVARAAAATGGGNSATVTHPGGARALMSYVSHVSPAACRTKIDVRLRNDVSKLGRMLGAAIQQEDPGVFEHVERLRELGRRWRAVDGDPAAFDEMVTDVRAMSSPELLAVARSFATFLALANTAENHHRVRKLKDSLLESGSDSALFPKEDSCGGVLRRLVADEAREGGGAKGSKTGGGRTREEVLEALQRQSVEIVLTAHPTEVNRKTLINFHSHIRRLLGRADQSGLSKYERRRIEDQLRAVVLSVWHSDELNRSKPSPVEEAKVGLGVATHVLWDAVPGFLRKLDDLARTELGAPLPLDMAPIRMASWMGGDRDGNPNVTPAITRKVSMLSRWQAAALFLADVQELRRQLALTTCSAELRDLAPGEREPYRAVLKQLEGRLMATVNWALAEMGQPPHFFTLGGLGEVGAAELFGSARDGGDDGAELPYEPITDSRDLAGPLHTIHRSLVETGMQDVADGPLVDTIRRVAAFGMAMLPLDLRQESARHTEALDTLTCHLGVGSYKDWDEAQRREWLLKELASKRPLLPPNWDFAADLGFSPTVVDTLETFRLAADLPHGSLGAYVISQCQQASDILAVMLLQQNAGIRKPLRVVPLFETLDDLQRAPDTVDALFSLPLYRERIGNKQEIMVGYSDSAKDAGRLAAAWAQYNSQVAMTEVAAKHNDGGRTEGVELTFFHGKGGTVGRGGNPALYEAILAHPPGTVQGRFRITEQGEMITQNYGQVPIAERTLDLFTAGVLAEQFTDRPVPKPEWRALMERLSEVSCAAYRKVVRGEERFVPYFRTATPELELAGLNVGSRPAKRNPKGGVESLRAIPWVFAWTQTRFNLPTWLGVGEALSGALRESPDTLHDMQTNWPWFATLVDLLEMILVKSEVRVAENYDRQLVTDPASQALGQELREKMLETHDSVLAVSQHDYLQQHNDVLLHSLAVRNPYVDPLNVIQAELLRRMRQQQQQQEDGGNGGAHGALSAEEQAVLNDALLITINGVANGMRNSG